MVPNGKMEALIGNIVAQFSFICENGLDIKKDHKEAFE